MEEWFTLEDIQPSKNTDKLYCISVDSPGRQFLAGDIGVPTHNSDQGKEEDAMKGEANMIIGSIARLGRAAGVHLIIATQRPDASILPGETKANLGVRINCGRTMGSASQMILENGEGSRVKSNPRGRLYLKIFGNGDHGQGFFAEQIWIDEYLASQGLNPDGTPLTNRRSKLANIKDMSQFEGADLDTREGVDNTSVIEKIREEEADEEFDSFMSDEDNDEEWGFGDDDDFDTEEGEIEEAPKDRPVLMGSNPDENQWHRPEDDWDLDDLLDENNS